MGNVLNKIKTEIPPNVIPPQDKDQLKKAEEMVARMRQAKRMS